MLQFKAAMVKTKRAALDEPGVTGAYNTDRRLSLGTPNCERRLFMA